MRNELVSLVSVLTCLAMVSFASAQALERAAIDSAKPPPAAATPSATSQATTAADPGEADFQAGRTLFFQSSLPAAVEKLKAAVAADGGKTAYRLLLAKAYRLQKQNAAAETQLQAILKLNHEHVEAAVELAEILLQRAKDIDNSLRDVKQEQMAAILAEKAKQYDEIIRLLDPLLKFRHDYPLYHLLAEAYYEKDDMAKAREYYEQAVKLNPRSGQDFYQLANIYLSESHFAKAADAYEKAHQLGKESALLHFKLASVYSNLRNYLGKVTTAVVLGGKSGEIKNELLLLDPVPGQKDTFYAAPASSAIFQVTRARKMGTDTPQLRFLEANIWLNARRYAKADEIYKTLEKKLDKADLGLFWFYWSQTALGLDDYDNYIARLKSAIAAEPKAYEPALADAYVIVARRYQQRGDNKSYIEFLSKAVDVNPLSAGLHLTLGDALWQLSKRAEASAQYKLVLELEPDHGDRVRLLNRIRGEADAPATPVPPPVAPAAGQ